MVHLPHEPGVWSDKKVWENELIASKIENFANDISCKKTTNQPLCTNTCDSAVVNFLKKK